MAKKMKPIETVMWVVGIIAVIGVGGLFTSGLALNFPILSILPLIIHQIVGWAIIGSAFIGLADRLGFI